MINRSWVQIPASALSKATLGKLFTHTRASDRAIHLVPFTPYRPTVSRGSAHSGVPILKFRLEWKNLDPVVILGGQYSGRGSGKKSTAVHLPVPKYYWNSRPPGKTNA